MRGRPGLLVFGGGRMGRLVVAAAPAEGYELRAVVARRQPDWVDASLWRASLDAVAEPVDLAVDFSLPDGTAQVAAWCAGQGVALVSGTTGLGAAQRRALGAAARRVPVLWAANFSIGVNVCLGLVAAAARQLRGVRTVEILERHHAHKKDAPSGTALALGAAVAPHQPNYESSREGEVIGDHLVRFGLPGELVEIVHRATDRGIYASGALQAGRWLLQQTAGEYSTQDWLGA